ncbi:MAG TPA: ATP-binding protein [Patescibacteria group bacterium]|jgi:type IV secretory pathway VirB4 component|nr:ATP-binding protein [Patescibacteria group bacterium]
MKDFYEMIVIPKTKYDDWRLRRDQRPKELALSYGEQDEIDILSYSGLEEQTSYLIIDNQFVRTLFISGYPFVASSGWLNSLINFNHNADISYHMSHVDAQQALPKLHRKITELESTKRAMQRSGKIIGPEITDPLESAQGLRDKILRGQEKLFQVSIYVTITTDSLAELDKTTKLLETVLSARLFYTKVARYQQLDGLQSVLPRGEDILSQKRNLDSSSAALTFPFMSSELVQESGILYGVNKSNNSLVILDRFSLHNANSIVFAQSGSGKSYATKVEILRQLMQGTKVIVIDPEREYKRLSESVKGTYIKLSAQSREKINPFDVAATNRSRQDLSEHTQDLTEVISLMAEGLSSPEKAAVDKAILKMYKAAKKGMPLLEDLYRELHNLGQLKLCERLEKYISGSLADVFNAQTNIELGNRLVIFDIKDMPESLRQIMMLIISNFVANQVKANPEKRLLVIDEGWVLLQHEESARFVASLVRRSRKYYLGVSIISQQASDFLKNDYGRAIASQSSLRILMRQDTTTIKYVVSEFNLSEYERNFLLTCDKGEALIIADQNHVAVKVVASAKEHPLITTNPAELYHL